MAILYACMDWSKLWLPLLKIEMKPMIHKRIDFVGNSKAVSRYLFQREVQIQNMYIIINNKIHYVYT